MDLERASLKALFYDYPIEHLMDLLLGDNHVTFVQPLVGLIQWRETAFTKSDLMAWCKTLFRQSGNDMDFSHTAIQVFDLLKGYAAEVLCYEHGKAYVAFPSLFRWRELSLCIGEDTLILPFLAQEDGVRDVKRSYFTWPDILPHNNHALNHLFDEGVSDIHTHLFASGNVVDLNWISFMNHLASVDNFAKKLTGLQELPIMQYQGDSLYPLRELCILAAFIRVKLDLFIQDHSWVQESSMLQALRSLQDELSFHKVRKEVLSDIDYCKLEALATCFTKEKVDYAIKNQSYSDLSSPYMLLCGERQLLYHYFLQLEQQPEEVSWFAPYVYLYLLIKTRFRKEFIQTNYLMGFQNFSDYQSRKQAFLGRAQGLFSRLFPLFAIQSCLRSEKDHMEVRVSPEVLSRILQLNFKPSFFDGEHSVWNRQQIDVVVHFIKGKSKSEYRKQLNQVLKDRDLLRNSSFRLVGLDAAGSEFMSRPEDFGHVFRYAKLMKIERATFHAGEDFYDLADGLRTMDEAVLFLQLSRGDRLGHGLALGLDAPSFYASRHATVAMPKLVLLDNLVWLYYKAQQFNITVPPAVLYFIQEKCFELYNDLYRSDSFDFFHYWNSMLLRSNSEDTVNNGMTLWQKAADCSQHPCLLAKKDKEAGKILKRYRILISDKKQYNGRCNFPKGYASLITSIQQAMQADLAGKGIAIECNPSSNLKIGRFSRYEEHPIFRFYPPGKNFAESLCLPVSVNTDDRGVFSTSLTNEFSLLALAMMKQQTADGKRVWSDETISNYLAKLIKNGKEQRFSRNYDTEEI